jgi:hypothetical protein
VTVTTPGGTSVTSTADQFTYRNIPTVTSIASPSAGPLSGGNTVTIYGTGFGVGMTPVPTVSFGGTPATNVVVSAGPIITCTAPAASVAGGVDVTVTTPGGTSATSTADQFTYRNIPTVTSIASPSAGPLSGGNTVTIYGTGFGVGLTPVPTVSFGGTPATNVVVSAGPTITCTAPAAGVAGDVNVTVTTPGGVSNAATYSY